MSLGNITPPGIGFGVGWKNSRDKARRRAAIARWAMADQAVGDLEVEASTLTITKVRALRQLVADMSLLAEHCDAVLCRKNLTDNEIALSVSVIVDAINARVQSRNKEA